MAVLVLHGIQETKGGVTVAIYRLVGDENLDLYLILPKYLENTLRGANFLLVRRVHNLDIK